MNEFVPPSSLILVAVMNDPRDLEIARLLGWYRIPLRSSPRVIAVDYLAFYQTAAFGEYKWRIQYIAPVKGHELTTRADLIKDESDHPRAHQEYFKVQLGPLLEIPSPIRTDKWYRITFFYTTGEYFNHANDMRDLVVASEERKILWQTLRDRADQSQDYRIAPPDDFELDFNMLSEFLGIKELEESELG